MSFLTLPFLSGLTGGFSHCIGMCGIFVLSTAAVSTGKSNAADYLSALWRQSLFHGGRLISLILLGAIAGSLGSLAGFRGHVPSIQACLSMVAGAVLGVLALGQLGVAPALRLPEPDILGSGHGRGRKLYSDVLRGRAWFRPFLLGLLIGLLPCGLTYYIVIYAIGLGSITRGMLSMAAFCVGTIPGLLTLGMLAEAAPSFIRSPELRAGMSRLSGIILLVMAVLLVQRGWGTLRGL